MRSFPSRRSWFVFSIGTLLAAWPSQAEQGRENATSFPSAGSWGFLESDPGLQQVQISQARDCGFRLHRLHLALEVELADHERYPSNLYSLSLIADPAQLVCPSDTNHVAGRPGGSVGETNVSYQLKLAGMSGTAAKTNVLVVCPVHESRMLEDGSIEGSKLVRANVDREEWARVMEAQARMTPPQKLEQEARKMARARQAMCDSNLKQIHLAIRMYELDNDSKSPGNFQAIKPSLGTPVVLTCPEDADKTSVSAWEDYSPERNLSYRMIFGSGIPASGETNKVMVVCPVHGRAVFSDGQVRPHGTPRTGSGKPAPRA